MRNLVRTNGMLLLAGTVVDLIIPSITKIKNPIIPLHAPHPPSVRPHTGARSLADVRTSDHFGAFCDTSSTHSWEACHRVYFQ